MKPMRMYMNTNGDRSFQANFDSHIVTFSGANFVAEKFESETGADKDKHICKDEVVCYDGGDAKGYNCKHKDTPEHPSAKEKLIYDEVVYYDGGGVEGYGDSKTN